MLLYAQSGISVIFPFIINLKMVQEISKNSALLVDGTSIPISRLYYSAVKDKVNNLIP
ncbi:hypothetical protein [Catenibacterium sp.]|uniref:hypothetical protein n=1 Tax=Catenibacterium sp. TaxID=2049022 RepID=UPI003FD80582